MTAFWEACMPLVDPGGVPGTRLLPGTQFFHIHIYFHQKVPALEVDAPPNGSTTPLREILDPPLYAVYITVFDYRFVRFHEYSNRRDRQLVCNIKIEQKVYKILLNLNTGQ